MDLAVYDSQRLLVCVEVKERTAQLQDLVKRLRTHKAAVNLSEPDRGDDPLRKAKYPSVASRCTSAAWRSVLALNTASAIRRVRHSSSRETSFLGSSRC